ncbi:MAG TPA: hypothetical protein ENJ95_12885 [Bacteroidetes bacterium]|nr:hypothetical protein [Bacteroidota bacterium]
MGKDAAFSVHFDFDEIFELVGQLSDEKKEKLCRLLKEELEKKGLIKWLELANAKTVLELQEPMEWEKDLPEEDEKEMTDEEYMKAINEMS